MQISYTADYTPPWWLRSSEVMTVYAALQAAKTWEKYTQEPEPIYKEHTFRGHGGIPIHGIVAIPPVAKGTIIATYGITGNLDNQWFLRLLGRKAFARGYAVVLFDWRAHGKTAQLSPVLTSDGIHEGFDYISIAEQAIELGCPTPIFLAGYSLGGQLALWGNYRAMDIPEIAGAAVICPSIESERSLQYLVRHPVGKYFERAITKELKKLANKLLEYHPQEFDRMAVDRANSIWGFDEHLVIPRLGFATVNDYYRATSPIYFLDRLGKRTLIIYAADDPLFLPDLVPELVEICSKNPSLELILTRYGGHVGYISDDRCQSLWQDRDPWWAWNRVLEWFDRTING
jgi:predicted alpha/beta-fold hydrolase